MTPWRWGHDIRKSISDNQCYFKNTCTKFHDKILNRYKEKISTYAKIGPQKTQKNGPEETGAIVWVYWPPILYQEQLYKISWKNIEWFSKNKVTWNTDKQKWLKYTQNQNPSAFFGVFDHRRNAELVPAKF